MGMITVTESHREVLSKMIVRAAMSPTVGERTFPAQTEFLGERFVVDLLQVRDGMSDGGWAIGKIGQNGWRLELHRVAAFAADLPRECRFVGEPEHFQRDMGLLKYLLV